MIPYIDIGSFLDRSDGLSLLTQLVEECVFVFRLGAQFQSLKSVVFL